LFFSSFVIFFWGASEEVLEDEHKQRYQKVRNVKLPSGRHRLPDTPADVYSKGEQHHVFATGINQEFVLFVYGHSI